MVGVEKVVRPAKSERRKQQNRQAQKTYRERQIRRLRTLEAAVESRVVDTIRVTPTEPLSPSGEKLDSNSTSLASSRVALLQLMAEPPNDSLRRSISNGEITIEDVLKAGITALSQMRAEASRLTPVSQCASPKQAAAPRTDQIYVLENRLQEHADYLPDWRSNSINIKQISSVAAIRRNAEMLGITFEMMTTVTSTSPLHDPKVLLGGQSTACASRWEHASPDMRPVPAQIRHPHHPWIDTLPSPTLRQRLIECISTDPPMIKEVDFCLDLQRDGLICWGSTMSGTQVASGSGAPWDVRSWEAQPWFLKKWWFVLGGDESELFRSSRWWSAMRGDRLEYAWK